MRVKNLTFLIKRTIVVFVYYISFSSYLFLYADESVFSAISSLKCLFEQKQDPSCLDIVFEPDDVVLLWKKACRSNDQDILALHHRFKVDTDDVSLEKELTKIWCKLKSKGTQKAEYSKYLMSVNHPLKSVLDTIFYDSNVTADEQTMRAAGFSRIDTQPSSFMSIAFHPALHGFLLKLYLDNETRVKDNILGYVWLIQRCQGAEEIRQLIKKKKIKYFTVPEKCLYQIPGRSLTSSSFEMGRMMPQPFLLVVEDMNLAPAEETLDAWKNRITTKHLDELYCILSHGYGSAYVGANVPLTSAGLFAFIDTEHLKRKIKYAQVKPFLSKSMRDYWDELVKKGGH